jgi:hypothetical protein
LFSKYAKGKFAIKNNFIMKNAKQNNFSLGVMNGINNVENNDENFLSINKLQVSDNRKAILN